MSNESEQTPPEDFRALSLIPRAEEVLSTRKPFLRKNIISGRYENVEHYLDVLFRLMKEDFVAPLRKDIMRYRLMTGNVPQVKSFSNTTFHCGVRVCSTKLYYGRLGIVVSFPKSNLHREQSSEADAKESEDRRFMHGSLVCFTADKFETILFGRILDWDKSESEYCLTVNFDLENSTYKSDVIYTMVECHIYFEPYYQTLRALKFKSDSTFPLKQYLVDVTPDAEPPSYLVNGSGLLWIEDTCVKALEDNWPEISGLNASQCSAFKAALTQKMAVIQGPPGTGKTHLGLKVAKTLLDKRNTPLWRNDSPMLVVCHSNIALDQFLEGLLSVEDNLIRVGGQSRSELLENRTLIRVKQRSDLPDNQRYSFITELKTFSFQISHVNTKLAKLTNINNLVRIANLEEVDARLRNSWLVQASHTDFFSWVFNVHRSSFEKVLQDHEVSNSCLSVTDEITSFSLRKFSTKIGNLRNELDNLKDGSREMSLRDKIYQFQQLCSYVKATLEIGSTAPPLDSLPDMRNLFGMDWGVRLQLYFYWLRRYRLILEEERMHLTSEYQEVYDEYYKLKESEDTGVLQKAVVVGMTTTGAARLQDALRKLKAKIVIVDEAAEVLEPHLTVALTEHCEHLILLGDHQQLQPYVADHKLKVEFNLGISLFERMILNNVQCYALDVQHRMRPEICSLISPHIYPHLKNHSSVENYPTIRGMESSMYFVNHTQADYPAGNESRANYYEALYLIRLVKYLLLAGYEPHEVTILTTYSGQILIIKNELKKFTVDDPILEVNIVTVDGFQGKESKIVLLSLVRNNLEGNVGFLKVVNRICVALSRAREGFYIMGNMDMLSQSCEIWAKIRQTLEEQNSLGTFLNAICQNHPECVTKLDSLESFDLVSDGGCSAKCQALLNCGHMCPKNCHVLDPLHEKTNCLAPCERTCENGHKTCNRVCFRKCSECTIMIDITLKCGHIKSVLCSDPTEENNNANCQREEWSSLVHQEDCKTCCEDCRPNCDSICNEEETDSLLELTHNLTSLSMTDPKK